MNPTIHKIYPHVEQELEYDTVLGALAELPKSELVETARVAIRAARLSNAARGNRIVHEWQALHDKAIAAIGAVNAAQKEAENAAERKKAGDALDATAPNLVGSLASVLKPLPGSIDGVTALVYDAAKKQVDRQLEAAIPAKAPPSYRVSVAANRSKLEYLQKNRDLDNKVTEADVLGLFEATVHRNDVKVAVVPVILPGGGPIMIASKKPSLYAFGPSFAESLMFVFRGLMNGPGMPLDVLLECYVDPSEHEKATKALDALVREGKVDYESESRLFRISQGELENCNRVREAFLKAMREATESNRQAKALALAKIEEARTAAAATQPLHDDGAPV